MAGDERITFAALLKQQRRLTGLTQEELAERAGYSPAYISSLERGVRTPLATTAELLADSLDLGPEERTRLLAAASRMAAQQGRGEAPGRRAPAVPSGPPLVGRAAETARIERHLAGRGTPVLLLTGEPGIGKSRLLQEAVARAAGSGYTVLQAGCQRHSARQAYVPLVDAVSAHLDALAPAEQRRALAGCDWLVRVMPELANTVAVPTMTLPAEQERRLAFRAMGQLLRNVAGPAGTLLLLDDLHWTGQDALDLLADLVQGTSGFRLAVIAAYRDTELASDSPLSVLMADLAAARLAEHLALGPLSGEESLALLDALLGGERHAETGADPDHLAALARRAEGVAFFLVSSAENLKSGVAPDAVPWDMAQGIRQRVAGLPARARELLGVAAVAGRTASLRLVLVASGMAEAEAVPPLQAAIASRLLEPEGESGYRFSHDVVREVVESDLGPPQRTVLHRRIAEALEAEGAAVELLAYHYARGGQSEQAIRYLELAGDRARAEHAYAAAGEHYLELLGHLDRVGRPADRARVQEKRGGVLLAAARYDEAIGALEEAVGLYRASQDLEGEVRVAALLGHAHFRRGTAAEGIRRLEPLLATADDQASGRITPRTVMEVDSALTHLYYAAGRFEESLACTERIAELARQTDDTAKRVEAELMRGIVLCALRSPTEGVRVLEAALPVAERADAVPIRENALQVLAGVYLIQGELAKGRGLLEQAIRLAEAEEDQAMLVVHLAQLARYSFVAGNWPEAHTHLARAVDIVRSIGPAWYTVLPLTQLGVLLEAEGDWEGALRYFEEVLSATESGRVARGAPLARIIPAEMDIRQARPERAVQRLAPLLAQAEADWANGTLTLATAAWAHLESGDTDAEALVQRALALAEKTSNRIDRVGALRVLAMLRRRAGAREEAERLFGEAVALASAIPYPYAEGRTLYEWGVALAGAGEAPHRLAEALTIFRRLGARKDVELTERALAALTSV